MKTLLIFGMIVFCSLTIAQNELIGLWKDTNNAISITFYPDQKYEIVSPYKGSGIYSVDGNLFWMKDGNSQQTFFYRIQAKTPQIWTFIDPQGNTIILHKEKEVEVETQNNDVVVHEANGVLFKESDVQTGLLFTEFLLERNLSSQEKKHLQEAWIPEFRKAPSNFKKSVEEIRQALQTIEVLNDPLKIGLVRQQMLFLLHQNTHNLSHREKPTVVRFIFKEIKIILSDEKENLILTNKDIQAFTHYLQFFQEMAGNPNPIQEKEVQKELVKQFSHITLEQKQILCCISLIWNVVEKNLKRMTPQQKQKFYHQITGQTSPSPTPENIAQLQEKWQNQQLLHQTLSRISLNSHVSMMNVIENIGGTSNYWTIKEE